MFRALRIFLLLGILATVVVSGWQSVARTADWKDSLHVTLYPIAADDSATSRQVVASLRPSDFAPIADWFQDETRRYGKPVLRPVVLQLAPPLAAQPPPFPADSGVFEVGLWSLQMRWWAWRHDAAPGPKPDVRLFLLYHDPLLHAELDHSLGLQKGQIGVVKVFASRDENARNSVVITHELLHTLGARDRYDARSLQPLFPEGYAEPQRQPRHPQSRAEIMAGRIPLSETRAEIPDRLADTLIGPATAAEIGLAERPAR